jgi:hypothetical protein
MASTFSGPQNQSEHRGEEEISAYSADVMDINSFNKLEEIVELIHWKHNICQ